MLLVGKMIFKSGTETVQTADFKSYCMTIQSIIVTRSLFQTPPQANPKFLRLVIDQFIVFGNPNGKSAVLL